MNDETVPAKKPQKTNAALPGKRFTPDEFKHEVQGRGWTYKLLAERWEVTPNWISKTARNEGRSMHWDDAVRGLPILLNKTRK